MIRSGTTRSSNAPEVFTKLDANGEESSYSNGTNTPISIDLRSYQTDEERQILDAVDKIREFDIDHDLDIPQIVVCGDQSAGKSSVLEAITSIKFPRGSNTCTRYVTEIQLRTAPIDSIKVTILPGPARPSHEKLSLEKFAEKAENLHNLPNLMKVAEVKMGLSAGPDGPRFLDDRLQIAVQGPNQPRLTLIDLPGLIRTEGSDNDLVASITKTYIQNLRSIILMVVGANYDKDNQEITTLAAYHDPKGERTFGVITKPDTTERGTPGEKTWVRIALNVYPKLVFRNGWHVLLNRNEKEVISNTSTEERNEKERRFFEDSTSEWSEVSPKNWGAQKLRENLVRLLLDHLKRQIPSLKTDIERKLAPIQQESRDLAASLKNKDEAGEVLRERCKDMEKITMRAVDGTNNDNNSHFGHLDEPKWEKDPRFLRSKIEVEADKFQTDMNKKGRNLQTTWNPASPPTAAEMEKYIDDVTTFLQNSRGHEAADVTQPQRLDILFHHHSKAWPDIARGYLSNCRDHCKKFLDHLTTTSLGPQMPHVVKNVQERQLDKLLEKRMVAALQELERLERDRLRATKTRNPAFLDGTREAYGKELHKMMIKAMPDTEFGKVPSKIAADMGMDTLEKRQRAHAVALMPRLHLSYKIAADVFVDNVLVQVTERHLLANLEDMFDEIRELRYKDKDEWDLLLDDKDFKEREEKLRLNKIREGNLQNCLDAVMRVI